MAETVSIYLHPVGQVYPVLLTFLPVLIRTQKVFYRTVAVLFKGHFGIHLSANPHLKDVEVLVIVPQTLQPAIALVLVNLDNYLF